MKTTTAELDNRITLQKLEVFCAVVDEGGMGRAADKLYLTQPVVSAHIKSLQERLGHDLFARDGRGVRLTEIGRSVYDWASDVVRGRERLEHRLTELLDGAAGSARIGASISVGSYLLPALLVSFLDDHPRAHISLHQSDVESALTGVLTGDLDVCVIATSEPLPPGRFRSKFIARLPYVLLAAPDDPVPAEVTAEQLAALPFVAPPHGSRIRSSQDVALAAIGVTDRVIRMELGSAESLKTAVERGMGLCMLTRVAAERELADGTLREVVVRGAAMHESIHLVTRAGTALSPLQQRLCTHLVETIRVRFPGADS